MEKMKLKDLINIRTGKLDANASSENGKYPFFTCSKETLKINTYSYDCECVLLAGNGDLNVKYYNGKFDAYQRTYILECKNDIISTKYLYYFMKKYLKILRNQSIGGVIKYIKLANISEAIIPIYSKEEQEKIVNNISKVEQILNIKNKQMEELQKFIKSQFVEMFGEPLISNNYGRITLDKLIKVSQGLQIPIGKRKNDKGRNRYKYITIQYLNGSKKEEYIENPNERVICNKEDILMTRTGNTGQVITNVEGVFHNNFFKMDYDRKIINKEFLIKYFENELIYKDIIRRATTSTIPDLSHSQFYKMSIDLPPLELQNQFSQIVKQIDKQKFEIEKSLKETQELYESLMEKYFG